MPEQEPFNRPQIVDASGKPARKATDTNCPKCNAPASRRVLSAGFGEPHDCCGQCGYEFEERTL